MSKIIVACDLNGGIGKDNKLLTHLRDDLNFFKEITKNKTIIMGRKTYESLPGHLPNRKHVVISRDLSYARNKKDIIVYTSLDSAIDNHPDGIIIGGGEIYKQALEKELIDTVYLTLILKRFEADTYFPDLPVDFKLTNSQAFSKDNHNKENFIINTFIKE